MHVGVIFWIVSGRELEEAMQIMSHKVVGLVWVRGGQKVGSSWSDVADDWGVAMAEISHEGALQLRALRIMFSIWQGYWNTGVDWILPNECYCVILSVQVLLLRSE